MDTNKSSRRARLWTWLLVLGLGGVTIAVVFSGTIAARYERRAAAFDLERLGEVRGRSSVYAANGEFYGYFGNENRLIVPLDAVSKHFVAALVAREDSRFWKHRGVDFLSVARASATNLAAGKIRQGASTITQQLARNAFELGGRSWDRKLLEMALARRIERRYSKEQILEFYVNRIYFGCGFYGIDAAARGYFGKPAAELSLGEAAVMAGLIRSPNKLAPVRDVAAAQRERDAVIDRMVETKVLSPADAIVAKAEAVRADPASSVKATGDFVMDAVRQELERTLAPDVLREGSLKVEITIDPQLQRRAEAAVDGQLTKVEERKGYAHPRKADFVPGEGDEAKPTDYLQGALVAIENESGAIRAVVGGRDYAHSSYSRALASKRPVGSTFKPFVFAAAFDRGMLPGTLVDDAEIGQKEFQNISKGWSPENSDGEHLGLQPAALGLLKSRNTMSVRVGEFAGLPAVRELARRAGLGDDLPDLPVIFLGTFEATLGSLTAAYTVFPNLGEKAEPHLVAAVTDREGHTLFRAAASRRRVLEPGTAWLVSIILQETMSSGTAAKSASYGWKKPSGGKTGTTNDYFDAWFVGYTSSLTCGAWVGFDQPRKIGDKAYGSDLALPIWVDFMRGVPENKYAAAPLRQPGDLKEVRLCKVSGLRANSACESQGCAYEANVPASRVPDSTCRTHVDAAPKVAYSDMIPPVGRSPAPSSAVVPPVVVPPPVTAEPIVARTPVPEPIATAPVAARPVPVEAAAPPPREIPVRPAPAVAARSLRPAPAVETLPLARVEEPEPAPGPVEDGPIEVRRAVPAESSERVRSVKQKRRVSEPEVITRIIPVRRAEAVGTND
jgi:penicillin-binding protein 1A